MALIGGGDIGIVGYKPKDGGPIKITFEVYRLPVEESHTLGEYFGRFGKRIRELFS